jgi:hypothetical protein
VEHEPSFVSQAWELVLQQPADLVHLSKPRLRAVVFGLLYKLLWGAAVLVELDDEELLFVGEREPRGLAVDLAQRSDGTFGVTPLAAARG